MKTQKFVSICLLTFLLLGLIVNTLQIAQANPDIWVTVWEDDFDDLGNVYSNDYSEITADGRLSINRTSTKIRGLQTLAKFNLTILFHLRCEALNDTGWYISLKSTTAIKCSTVQLDSTSDPCDIGAYFEVVNIPNSAYYKIKIWKYWTTTTEKDMFDYTNQTDNVLEMQFDGVNYKVAYTLNDVYLGEWDFYNRANRTGSINPIVFDGEFEIWHSSTTGTYGMMKISKITQRVKVSDEKVVPCAGKLFGLGFDAPYASVYDNALSVIDSNDGTATIFVDQHYAENWEASSALNYTMDKWLIENRKWELGLHTYHQLKSYDNDTACQWLADEYAWVYANLTYAPEIWVGMAHSMNWTHGVQYAWENYGIPSRIWALPIITSTPNQTVAGYVQLTENYLPWFEWAINDTMDGGGVRSLFCFTHKVADPVPNAAQDISLTSFTSLLNNAHNDGYKILPFNEGYRCLLNTYNSTFTILETSTSTLKFSVSTGDSEHNVYVWAKKPSGSGTWYVYDDLNQKITIWEDLPDKVGFYAEHGKTYTLRDIKLDSSIDSCSPHYADITRSESTASTFCFSISAYSGTTSTIELYCGSKGEPTSVTGTKYDAETDYSVCTKILTLTVEHSSSASIVVNWGSGASGLFNLYISVLKDGYPTRAIINLQGENRSIYGLTRFELPYGTYEVTVYCGDTVQTKQVGISNDMNVGFNFESASEPLNPAVLAVPITIILAVALFIFLRRKH